MFWTPYLKKIIVCFNASLSLLFPGEGEQKSGWFSAAPYVEVGEFYRRHFARLKTSPGNFRIAQHS